MKKLQYLTIACLFAGSVAAVAQTPAKAGDAKSGKATFDQQCGLCHDAMSTDRKVGPGLKGLYKRAKLADGKAVNDANVLDRIDNGSATGMPPFKDGMSASDKANVIAYLKTL